MSLFDYLLSFYKNKQKAKPPEKKTGLYYDKMIGAAGHIHCTECSFIVMVDVWIHDYRTLTIKTSYQCLDCGEFKNLSFLKDDAIQNCSCGGTLSRSHKLFCPVCKGDKLQYMCYYFT